MGSKPHRLGPSVWLEPERHFHVHRECLGEQATLSPQPMASGFPGVSFAPTIKQCLEGITHKAGGTEGIQQWFAYTPVQRRKAKRIDEFEGENLGECRSPMPILVRLLGVIEVDIEPFIGGGPASVVRRQLKRVKALGYPLEGFRWKWLGGIG